VHALVGSLVVSVRPVIVKDVLNVQAGCRASEDEWPYHCQTVPNQMLFCSRQFNNVALGFGFAHRKFALRSTIQPATVIMGRALPGQAFFISLPVNFSPAVARGFFCDPCICFYVLVLL
jgi:hypothetical protein